MAISQHLPASNSTRANCGSPAAHYINDHREFEGIIVPVQRVVHMRDENRQPVPEPVTVSIDIDEVTVG